MSEILDSIIIGAGPAGLTAALYTARAGLKVKIFEAKCLGGQIILTEWIDNFPGFPNGISSCELVSNISAQVQELGVEVDLRQVEVVEKLAQQDVFQIRTADESFLCRSLILAMGASPAKLGIPGEQEFMAKGVSYCATCDGPLFKNKTVAVIGGGNSAVEETMFLSRFVKKIYLSHRRQALRASAILQERLKKIENCQLLLGFKPIAIEGKDRVSGLRIENVSDGQVQVIACDGVFIFAGIIPNSALVKSLVKTDAAGYIIVDSNMRTSQEGIFACGDCIVKELRQVVTACADGANAAYAVQNFLIKY